MAGHGGREASAWRLAGRGRVDVSQWEPHAYTSEYVEVLAAALKRVA